MMRAVLLLFQDFFKLGSFWGPRSQKGAEDSAEHLNFFLFIYFINKHFLTVFFLKTHLQILKLF